MPLHSTLAPDAFEGARAFAELRAWRPGSPTAARAAPATTASPRRRAQAAGARRHRGRRLLGCAPARRRADGRRRAHARDRRSPSAPARRRRADPDRRPPRRRRARLARPSCPATAALLELARVFDARETKRSDRPRLHQRRQRRRCGRAELLPDLAAVGVHGPFDAAIVLGDLAASSPRRPIVVPYSDGLGSAPLRAAAHGRRRDHARGGLGSGRAERVRAARAPRLPARRRRAGGAERAGAAGGARAGERRTRPGRDERVQRGAPAKAWVAACSAPSTRSTWPRDVPTDLQTGLVAAAQDDAARGRCGCSLGTLLLPPLVAVADGLARAAPARASRSGAGRCGRSAADCRFCGCALFAWLLGALGIIGAVPSLPAPPSALPLDAAAITALVAVALTFVLAWLLLARCCAGWGSPSRSPARRRGRRAAAGAAAARPRVPGAGSATRYAALLCIPALHLWLLIAVARAAPAPRRSRSAWSRSGSRRSRCSSPSTPTSSATARAARHGRRCCWSPAGTSGCGSALLWSVAFGCTVAAGLVAALGRLRTRPWRRRTSASRSRSGDR